MLIFTFLKVIGKFSHKDKYIRNALACELPRAEMLGNIFYIYIIYARITLYPKDFQQMIPINYDSGLLI